MASSARIGQPVRNDGDYWIARSFLKAAGKTTNPTLGAKVPPLRPPPNLYHYETKGPSIIAACTGCVAEPFRQWQWVWRDAVSMVIMFSITVFRLMLRWRKKEQKFGSDDWVIIPGVVRVLQRPKLHFFLYWWTNAISGTVTGNFVPSSSDNHRGACWRRKAHSKFWFQINWCRICWLWWLVWCDIPWVLCIWLGNNLPALPSCWEAYLYFQFRLPVSTKWSSMSH